MQKDAARRHVGDVTAKECRGTARETKQKAVIYPFLSDKRPRASGHKISPSGAE